MRPLAALLLRRAAVFAVDLARRIDPHPPVVPTPPRRSLFDDHAGHVVLRYHAPERN